MAYVGYLINMNGHNIEKIGCPVLGDRGLIIQKSIGGSSYWAELSFYKGLDIQYHAFRYATRMTPQKGGIQRPRLRLI